MIERCTKSWHHKYPTYGGAGVSVCKRWFKFENFLADVGERPPGTTLDRYPTKNGNYVPGNVRWATIFQQNNNKKTNIIVIYRRKKMTIAQAARRAGVVSAKNAAKRIVRGWSVKSAVETPLRP